MKKEAIRIMQFLSNVSVIKGLAVCFSVTALIIHPKQAASSDYERIIIANAVIEKRGGSIVQIPQPPLVKAISKYLSQRTSVANPFTLAQIIADNAKRPLLMTVIGDKETGMRCDKVGSRGELGPWQLMDNWRPADYSCYDWHQNLQLAERVLDLKTKPSGSLYEGVKRYNGGGKAAEQYRNDVFARLKILKRMLKEEQDANSSIETAILQDA